MKPSCHLLIGIMLVLLIGPASDACAQDSSSETIQCTLKFNLKGWSAFYKTAQGRGQVECTNGQRADVKINVTGGGVTFGQLDIHDGNGRFTQLLDIEEIYGGYVAAEAHAGAGQSTQAAAYTKGSVSLTVTGKGRGFNIGFDFGRFEISR